MPTCVLHSLKLFPKSIPTRKCKKLCRYKEIHCQNHCTLCIWYWTQSFCAGNGLPQCNWQNMDSDWSLDYLSPHCKASIFPIFWRKYWICNPKSWYTGIKRISLWCTSWQGSKRCSAFNCTWPKSSVPYNTDHWVSTIGNEDRLHVMSDKFCTREEKLEDLKNMYLDVSQLRITDNVEQAVYSMA